MIAQILAPPSITIAALLLAYRRRRARVADFAQQATRGVVSQREAVFELARRVFSEVERSPKNPIFISRLLGPLGASPATVLDGGACCNGIHRLFIASLKTLGIRSAQVTVFRRADPVNAHCLAQVWVGDERLLIDVDYGIWLRHPDGSPVDVLGLRRGEVPTIQTFVEKNVARYRGSERTRSAGYPDREYYRFDYEVTRTANWAMSRLRRAVYAGLHQLTQGRIDVLFLPPILEWPEVLLSIGVAAAALVFVLGWVAIKGF